MKRILILALSLLIAISAEAQVRTNELLKLGMPAALASKVGAAIGDSKLEYTTTSFGIFSNEADGSNTAQVCIGGGSQDAAGEGGRACFYGNENSNKGDAVVRTGSTSGSDFRVGLQASDSTLLVQNASNTTFVTFDQTEGIVTAAGKYVNTTAYVPTMAATPALGTNQVLPGLNVVPTAAANTAAWLGASTPVAGQQFKIYNNSGAVVRVKGAGAATLNGGSAGTYIGMAASSYMECLTVSTGNQQCPYYSVNGAVAAAPTPAGP